MTKFLIMPNDGKWYPVESSTAEMAYREVCCFFNPSRKIAVMSTETCRTRIYMREVDITGHITAIREVTGL